MLHDNHLFDFSGYKDDHPCFANMSLDDVKCIKQQNEKVIGEFKDELDGVPLHVIVGFKTVLFVIWRSRVGRQQKVLRG